MADGGHVAAQATEYLDGALAPADRVAFETHVAACPACAQVLHELCETIRLLGQLPPEPLTADARDRLLGTFRRWRDGRA